MPYFYKKSKRKSLPIPVEISYSKWMEVEERLAKHLKSGPKIHPSAYVAPSAELIGDVRVGPNASIWPTSVLRGDINYIEVGEGTNIQDGTLIHLSDDFPVKIGKNVTIGHGAMIHACEIGDGALIGMRATILDGAVIGEGSIVGAGAVVTKNTVIPPRSLVLGVPAKVKKTLTEEASKKEPLLGAKISAYGGRI